MIERYLQKSDMLKTVFLLVDIRHEPGANDRQMYDWIVSNGYQPVIIATKADKIRRSQLQKQIRLIRSGLEAAAGTVILYNKKNGEVQKAIDEQIDALIKDGTLGKISEKYFKQDNFQKARELGAFKD